MAIIPCRWAEEPAPLRRQRRTLAQASWVTTMTGEAYKEPMLRSVVCACVLVIGEGVVVGCGGSSSKPLPPSMAALARTFIQHGHPLPPSYSDLVHYGWRVDPSRSHCTARDTGTLGEGGDPERAHQGTREEFCHFYFIGTPASGDGLTPPIRPHKMHQGWYVAWHCDRRWTHCYIASEQHVSPTGAGPVDNPYSQ